MSFEKMNSNKEQVQRFLDEHFQSQVTDLAALSGGEWSEAFGFKYSGNDYVARFGQFEEDYLKDQFASGYGSPQLPIPKVLEVGKGLGGYYAISERAFGTMLDDQPKEAMKLTIPSLFATMDAIRETDISQFTGFGYWDTHGNGTKASWREMLLDVATDEPNSKTHGWKSRLKDSPVGEEPWHEAYANLIELSKGLPDTRSLVHNDLLNFNVLVNNSKITAVIDWANAFYGDFLYDLAQFTFWGPLHEPVKGIDWEAEALAHYTAISLEVPDFKRRLQCCMVHMGLDAQAYFAYKSNWTLFEAVAERTLEISQRAWAID